MTVQILTTLVASHVGHSSVTIRRGSKANRYEGKSILQYTMVVIVRKARFVKAAYTTQAAVAQRKHPKALYPKKHKLLESWNSINHSTGGRLSSLYRSLIYECSERSLREIVPRPALILCSHKDRTSTQVLTESSRDEFSDSSVIAMAFFKRISSSISFSFAHSS